MRVWPLVVLVCAIVVIGMTVTTFAPPVTTGGVYPSSVPVTDGNILEFDGTSGWRVKDSGVAVTDVDGALENVVEDTTPQAGGDLDMNGHGINDDSGDNDVDIDDDIDLSGKVIKWTIDGTTGTLGMTATNVFTFTFFSGEGGESTVTLEAP